MDRQTAIRSVLGKAALAGMRAVAEQHGLLWEDRIDFRGGKAKFQHKDLDLRAFALEGCDLTGSRFTSCVGEGVRFDGCRLKDVEITAARGQKVSFRGASFAAAVLDRVSLGPATLDLAGTDWRAASLKRVEFSMGRLADADFSKAVLRETTFRKAVLTGVRFRDAELVRVCFEDAKLAGADFTGASFQLMDWWGEPDYEGALIPDELRYSFGTLTDPLARIDRLLESGQLEPEAAAGLRLLRERHRDLLSHPEVMLIGREHQDSLPGQLFPRVLKALKAL